MAPFAREVSLMAAGGEVVARPDAPRADSASLSAPRPQPVPRYRTLDANEAVARIAHRLSEVIAICPITPASAMGEYADAWATDRRPNLWDTVPEVVEMQSEGGAAGAVHGALQPEQQEPIAPFLEAVKRLVHEAGLVLVAATPVA